MLGDAFPTGNNRPQGCKAGHTEISVLVSVVN